jgi:transcriptional regulator with XRE-family HTH domain
MIDAAALKTKRTTAGIPGSVLCKKLRIARSRLSDIERGYIVAQEEELARIDSALDDLIRAKRKIDAVAIAEGWPSSL